MITRYANSIQKWISKYSRTFLKWASGGMLLMLISLFLIHNFVVYLHFTVSVATALAAEICTLIRFVINNYWVFGRESFSIRGCMEFHLANFGTFIIWWVAANSLHLIGIHYLLATIMAVGLSVIVSFASTFFWVWKSSDTDKKN